mmetsp:Transcript_87482/g.152647  ORF Transcript_87482/g.152647 Transcript_87482/m.152647 type:complete len:95 (-) Transcript_87482:8-292(-)
MRNREARGDRKMADEGVQCPAADQMPPSPQLTRAEAVRGPLAPEVHITTANIQAAAIQAAATRAVDTLAQFAEARQQVRQTQAFPNPMEYKKTV